MTKIGECQCLIDYGRPIGCCTVTKSMRAPEKGRRDILCIKNSKGLRRGSFDDLRKLQTFPKTFKLSESKTQALKELGEAVPPKLAVFLAKELKKSFR